MHGTQFSAAMQLRNRLAGVEQRLRIKGCFNCVKYIAFGIAELQTHLIEFFDAYPVFTSY